MIGTQIIPTPEMGKMFGKVFNPKKKGGRMYLRSSPDTKTLNFRALVFTDISHLIKLITLQHKNYKKFMKWNDNKNIYYPHRIMLSSPCESSSLHLYSIFSFSVTVQHLPFVGYSLR